VAEFYPRLQLTSQRLLKKFKQGTVIYNAPGSAGDPFTPATASTPYGVDAVQAPAGRKQTYIDGGYITATDILLAVAPFAVEPSQSGTMNINAVVYQIVFVDSPTVEPASPLVWFIGCRK
jgi:hypothetical protein